MASTGDDNAADATVFNVSSKQDDPEMSSAALCLSFSFLSSSFRPEFTHQIFEGEWIRGYQPFRRIMTDAAVKSHSSHVHHNDEETSHELQVEIALAPSCRMSSVDVTAVPKATSWMVDSSRSFKRPRLTANGGSAGENEDLNIDKSGGDKGNSGSSNADGLDDSSPASLGRGRWTHENTESAGNQSPPMPVEEILLSLDKGLPKRAIDNPSTVVDDYLPEPVGTVLRRYRRKDQDFVVTVADGAQATEYHAQLQRLALWFIETAQDVDVTSDGGEGGYWKVLYLFCEYRPQRYALAGYMTVFHFEAPFKKPKPGIVARVCQALILPPFQRSGHGKTLLKVMHDDYVLSELSQSKDIVEINVEDPAPGFVALRNRVDFERLQDSLSNDRPWLPEKYTASDPSDDTYFVPLSESDAIVAGAISRLTPRQVQVAHEMYKLSLLPGEESGATLTKKYRLMVKKRLLRVHKEELGSAPTKEAKQAMLGKLFDETLSCYKAALGRT